MQRSNVKLWLGLLMSLLLAYTGYSAWRFFRLAQQSDAPPHAPVELALLGNPIGRTVGDFSLTERSGRTVDREQFGGKIWVVNFFFASCPGACLRMNNTIARLQTEISDPRLVWVSITVDPDNDTPAALVKYAQHYAADPEHWLFLTGEKETIRRMSEEDFLVSFAKVSHSDRLMLIDGTGRVVGYYRVVDDTVQQDLLLKNIRRLLSESTPPETEEAAKLPTAATGGPTASTSDNRAATAPD